MPAADFGIPGTDAGPGLIGLGPPKQVHQDNVKPLGEPRRGNPEIPKKLTEEQFNHLKGQIGKNCKSWRIFRIKDLLQLQSTITLQFQKSLLPQGKARRKARTREVLNGVDSRQGIMNTMTWISSSLNGIDHSLCFRLMASLGWPTQSSKFTYITRKICARNKYRPD